MVPVACMNSEFTTHAIQSILHGPRTTCLLTDFGILNSIACRILNSDQFLYWILTENELEIRDHINFTEKVAAYRQGARACARGGAPLAPCANVWYSLYRVQGIAQ